MRPRHNQAVQARPNDESNGRGAAGAFDTQRLTAWLLSNRAIYMFALLALVSFAAFLILRIGILPAASAGDDLWFDDSAYWLLHEGVLRRHIHQNALGDGVRDFLPPMVGLFTAASFWMFGLTQFAVGIAPTAATTVGVAGFAAGLRNRFGMSFLLALGMAMAIFFAPDFLKVAGHNRFEAYVFMFIGLGLFAGSFAPRSRSVEAVLLIVAGLAAGGAVVSHYPVAPLSWSIVALWTCFRTNWLSALIFFCIGTAVAGALGLLWIGNDLHLFLFQMITSGARYHHSLTGVPKIGLLYLVVALICAVLVFENRFSRYFSFIAILSVLAMPWWVTSALYGMIAVTIALVSFLAVHSAENRSSWKVASAHIQLLLMLASTTLVSLTSTAYAISTYQQRDFAAFKSNLLSVLPRDNGGLVLIDRTPHLALRSCYSAGQLHHLIGFLGATMPSRILLDPGKATSVQAVIVSTDLPDGHLESMPLYRSFMSRPVKSIDVSPFGIGSKIHHKGPYHVIVYLPLNDTGPRLSSSCQ